MDGNPTVPHPHDPLTHFLARYSPGTSSCDTSCVRTSPLVRSPASSTPFTTSASNAFPSSSNSSHSPNPHFEHCTSPANLPIGHPTAPSVPPGECHCIHTYSRESRQGDR